MEEALALKTEGEIAEYVREHVEELIPGTKLLKSYPERRIGRFTADLLLTVEIGRKRKTLVCEIKSVGEPRYLFQAVAQLRRMSVAIKNGYPVVIAPLISERGREICKESGIGFLDLTGNIFLKFGAVHIEKVGKEKLRKSKSKVRSLFSLVSSRILRALLEEPQRYWRLTELSEESNASIGHVHKVVMSLREQEYVEKEKRGVRIKDPGKLLDEWSGEYNFSANNVRSFYSFIREPIKMMQKIEDASKKLGLEYALTMHAGASLIAPFVRFTDVHFYIKGELERWVKELDLRPVEFGGTIHLVEPYGSGAFYRTQNIEGIMVVSNIQLYLDLYNYPTRGREQAEFLRKEKMRF